MHLVAPAWILVLVVVVVCVCVLRSGRRRGLLDIL